MASETYYQILGVNPDADVQQIQSAFEVLYGKWLRMVDHRDAQIVQQARQAVQLLERIRSTLKDPVRRAAYDDGLGLGPSVAGLGNPDALLAARLCGADLSAGTMQADQGTDQNQPDSATPVPGATPAVVPSETTAADAAPAAPERIDAWICSRCGAASAIGTAYCARCGAALGQDCPFCKKTISPTAIHCPHCGVDIADCRKRVAESCAICKEPVRSAAARCASCGVDLRAGPGLVAWFDERNIALQRTGGTFVGTIVEGTYLQVLEACAAAIRAPKEGIEVGGKTYALVLQSVETDEGRIRGRLGGNDFTIRIQPGEMPQRGVAILLKYANLSNLAPVAKDAIVKIMDSAVAALKVVTWVSYKMG